MSELFALEPAPGRVIVEPEDALKAVHIHLLDSKQKGQIGRIVAVYEPFIKPEEVDEETETVSIYNVGDRVIFGPYSGVDLRIERSRYVVMKETEILAKIRELPENASVGVGETEYDDTP